MPLSLATLAAIVGKVEVGSWATLQLLSIWCETFPRFVFNSTKTLLPASSGGVRLCTEQLHWCFWKSLLDKSSSSQACLLLHIETAGKLELGRRSSFPGKLFHFSNLPKLERKYVAHPGYVCCCKLQPRGKWNRQRWSSFPGKLCPGGLQRCFNFFDEQFLWVQTSTGPLKMAPLTQSLL